MAITRLQSATNGQTTGANLALTLSSTPVQGNILFLFVTHKDGLQSTAASTVTQTGVTWTLRFTHETAFDSTITDLWTGVVGSGASTAITVALTGAGTNAACGIVIEYEGVTDTLHNSNSGTSTASSVTTLGLAITTTPPNHISLGDMVNTTSFSGNPSSHTLTNPNSPTNIFTQVAFVRSAATVNNDHVGLSVQEQFYIGVSAVGGAAPFTNKYAIALAPSSTQQMGYLHAAFDAYQEFNLTASLDVSIADTYEKTASMNVHIGPGLYLPMSMFIQGTDTRTANLNVFFVSDGGSPQIALLDAIIAGEVLIPTAPDVYPLLDLYIIGEVFLTTGLQVLKSLHFTRTANLNVHIGVTDERKTVKLDVLILVQPSLDNSISTPEDSAYDACRPLWCNVPKQKNLVAYISVIVGGVVLITLSSDVLIQTTNSVYSFMQVLINPVA